MTAQDAEVVLSSIGSGEQTQFIMHVIPRGACPVRQVIAVGQHDPDEIRRDASRLLAETHGIHRDLSGQSIEEMTA